MEHDGWDTNISTSERYGTEMHTQLATEACQMTRTNAGFALQLGKIQFMFMAT